MALLSRLRRDRGARRATFSDLLWRDLPGALLPEADGRPFPSDAVFAMQRLSTTAPLGCATWNLRAAAVLHVLAWHATPAGLRRPA
jgi:hypothetical protein